MKYRLENTGTVYELDVELTPQGYRLRGPDGQEQLIQLRTRDDGSQLAITPWGDIEIRSARRGAELWADVDGRRLSARVERARPSGAGSANARESAGAVLAPMAGKLLRVAVAVGELVSAGQALAIIEAMKMENELLAAFDGTVVEVAAAAPGTVDKGALIVRLEPR
jgi:biotin carboxyl carrier protein